MSNKKTKIKNENLWYINYIIYSVIFILPVGTGYYYVSTAFSANHFFSFPLDDPWIHLQFARNIMEYFSFSYYKNEMVTAGSTSPLYVFIAAIGFLFTNNEMILSYVLGIFFFALSSVFFYKLAQMEFDKDITLSILVSLLFIFDSYMNFIAASGMETTLFIMILLLGVYFYKCRKTVALGIILGLIFWTRPDGSAFIAAIVLDYFYSRWIVKEKITQSIFSLKEFFTIMGIFTAFLLAYFAMNLYLSGTILSNTYSAKVAQFIDSDARIKFLTVYIWQFFTADHLMYLMPGFVLVCIKFFHDLLKRSYNQNAIYILFIFIFIFIYLIKLPMYSKFGRYFMPMIPFYIMSSMCGYFMLFNFINDQIKKPLQIKIVNSAVIIALVVFAIITFKNFGDLYAVYSKFVYDRQVKTAYWLKDNTTESDIVATHDIGAIGYYSGRRIVDIAGLLDPELAKNSNNEEYNEILNRFFAAHGVTYASFFREWFMLLNQNPVYITPGEASKEAISTYKFIPGKSKLLQRKILYLLAESHEYLKSGNSGKLISSMNNMLSIEPDYAPAYFYRAYGHSLTGDMKGYENDLKRAIELYPDYRDALIEYGNYLIKSERLEEAGNYFNKVLDSNPSDKNAKEGLFRIKEMKNK